VEVHGGEGTSGKRWFVSALSKRTGLLFARHLLRLQCHELDAGAVD
jgi:hypothetical protein